MFFTQDKIVSFMLTSAIHAGVLFGGNAILLQSAEYGVELGEGGVEIHLIAAPAPASVEAKSEVLKQNPEPEEAPLEDDAFLIDEEKKEEAQEATPEKVLPSAAPMPASDKIGDGSSPVAGKDATTFHSGKGAITKAKPNYLKNPPPRYPEDARSAGEEGVVHLLVHIDKSGNPISVAIKQSSGYIRLDEAALKAVQRWKFQPARLGSLPMESNVQIPIRFSLNNN